MSTLPDLLIYRNDRMRIDPVASESRKGHCLAGIVRNREAGKIPARHGIRSRILPIRSCDYRFVRIIKCDTLLVDNRRPFFQVHPLKSYRVPGMDRDESGNVCRCLRGWVARAVQPVSLLVSDAVEYRPAGVRRNGDLIGIRRNRHSRDNDVPGHACNMDGAAGHRRGRDIGPAHGDRDAAELLPGIGTDREAEFRTFADLRPRSIACAVRQMLRQGILRNVVRGIQRGRRSVYGCRTVCIQLVDRQSGFQCPLHDIIPEGGLSE